MPPAPRSPLLASGPLIVNHATFDYVAGIETQSGTNRVETTVSYKSGRNTVSYNGKSHKKEEPWPTLCRI